jgi:translation initiation factor RLI1
MGSTQYKYIHYLFVIWFSCYLWCFYSHYVIREGINLFLDISFILVNTIFREFSLSFKIVDNKDIDLSNNTHNYKYPSMTKKLTVLKLQKILYSMLKKKI